MFVSTCVYCCVKETDRSRAAGNHSPETFISHYPERRGEKEHEEMGRSKRQRGIQKRDKNKYGLKRQGLFGGEETF